MICQIFNLGKNVIKDMIGDFVRLFFRLFGKSDFHLFLRFPGRSFFEILFEGDCRLIDSFIKFNNVHLILIGFLEGGEIGAVDDGNISLRILNDVDVSVNFGGVDDIKSFVTQISDRICIHICTY